MLIFYLLVFTMPMDHHQFWAQELAGISLIKWIGIACLFVALLRLLLTASVPSIFGYTQGWLCLVYFVYAVVSFLSQGLTSSIENPVFTNLISMFLLFLITPVLVDSVARLRWVALTAIGATSISSLYIIREWQKFHNVYVDFRPWG